MPTKTYNRTWCKICNDWTLHRMNDEKEQVCNDCNTVFTTIKLIDIPEDKLKKQRKRYIESTNPVNRIMSMLYDSSPSVQMAKMFQSPGSDIIITEEDAGQEKIGEQNRIKYEKYSEERNKLKEEALKYKNLNRNDICICGSGKKYKQCCLNKFNNL